MVRKNKSHLFPVAPPAAADHIDSLTAAAPATVSRGTKCERRQRRPRDTRRCGHREPETAEQGDSEPNGYSDLLLQIESEITSPACSVSVPVKMPERKPSAEGVVSVDHDVPRRCTIHAYAAETGAPLTQR